MQGANWHRPPYPGAGPPHISDVRLLLLLLLLANRTEGGPTQTPQLAILGKWPWRPRRRSLRRCRLANGRGRLLGRPWLAGLPASGLNNMAKLTTAGLATSAASLCPGPTESRGHLGGGAAGAAAIGRRGTRTEPKRARRCGAGRFATLNALSSAERTPQAPAATW